jgi:hypothetical protein
MESNPRLGEHLTRGRGEGRTEAEEEEEEEEEEEALRQRSALYSLTLWCASRFRLI